jgi:DNA-binding transcriptional ArsR family regulator
MRQTKKPALTALLREDGMAGELADLYKVFGDATRLKILATLVAAPASVSHQLRFLKDARVVRGVKSGKEVTYSLDDDHVGTILTDGFAHAAERRRGEGGHGGR